MSDELIRPAKPPGRLSGTKVYAMSGGRFYVALDAALKKAEFRA